MGAGIRSRSRREQRLRSLLTGTIVFDNKCTKDLYREEHLAYGARSCSPTPFVCRKSSTCASRITTKRTAQRSCGGKKRSAGFALSDVEEIAHPGRHRVDAARERSAYTAKN